MSKKTTLDDEYGHAGTGEMEGVAYSGDELVEDSQPVDDSILNGFKTEDWYYEVTLVNGEVDLVLYGDKTPEASDRTPLRESIHDVCEALYKIVHQEMQQRMEYTFGRVVNEYVTESPLIDDHQTLDSIVEIEDVTSEEFVAYSRFADVYADADPDEYTEVNPLVVSTLSTQYNNSGTVRKVAGEIASHPDAVATGTLTEFEDHSGLDVDTDATIASLQGNGVKPLAPAVQHFHILTRNEPPDEETLREMDAVPSSQPRGIIKHTDGTRTTAEPTDNTDPAETQPNTPSENGSVSQLLNGVSEADSKHEQYSLALSDIPTTDFDRITQAWITGAILNRGQREHDLSCESVASASTLTLQEEDIENCRVIADIYDQHECPDDVTLEEVETAVSQFDTEATLTRAIEQCAEVSTLVTTELLEIWRTITDFQTQAVITAVVDAGVTDTDIIPTVQALFEFEGIPAPREDRIGVLLDDNPTDMGVNTNPSQDTVELETIFTESYESMYEQHEQGNISRADKKWLLGHLVEEFNTEHELSYSDIADLTEHSTTVNSRARKLHKFFRYGEIPKSVSTALLCEVATAMEADDKEVRERLVQSITTGVGPTATSRDVIREIDSVSLDTVAEQVDNHDYDPDDPVDTVKFIYHTQSHKPPETDKIKRALDSPDSMSSITPPKKDRGNTDIRTGIETGVAQSVTGVRGVQKQDERSVAESLGHESSQLADNGPTGVDKSDGDNTQTEDTTETASEEVYSNNTTDNPNEVQIADSSYTTALTEATSVSVNTERSSVTADADTRKVLINKYSPAIPSSEIVSYTAEFDTMLTVVTGSGVWTQLLAERGVEGESVNPSLPHFGETLQDADVTATTTYALRETVAEADTLFLPTPSFAGDVVADLIREFAEGDGETVLYLGPLPPVGKSGVMSESNMESRAGGLETIMGEMTREFTYVTTVQGTQWENSGVGLHVFTRTGETPEAHGNSAEATAPTASGQTGDE